MIWLLIAVAAGVAIWAMGAMRSGAIKPERGRPVAWGAGGTAGLLVLLSLWSDYQERRAAEAFMQQFGEARRSFNWRQDNFNRDFKARQDAFDRSFKEQGDRFDRAFEERRAAIETARPGNQASTGEDQ